MGRILRIFLSGVLALLPVMVTVTAKKRAPCKPQAPRIGEDAS